MMFTSIFWILIMIGGVYFLVKWLDRKPEARQHLHALLPGRSSLDILKERYARGEIDRAEFERIKLDLLDLTET